MGDDRNKKRKRGPDDAIWASTVSARTPRMPADVKKRAACQPGPSAASELRRFQKMKKLRSKLHKACSKLGVAVPLLAFERWQCRSKLDEQLKLAANQVMAEPLLPCMRGSDQGLIKDLVRGGMQEHDAERIASAISAEAEKLAGEEQQEEESEADVTHAVFQGGIVDFHWREPDAKPYMRIGRAHYEKLKTLYCRARGLSKRSLTQEQLAQLHTSIMVLLLRYEALGGHGFQAALGGESFDVLYQQLECSFECFASPLNCRYDKFCSAFEDTDTPFGSLGSFFSPAFCPADGKFEANPPFVPELMEAMVKKIERLLEASQGEMLFVVVVPAWKELPFWKLLTSSAWSCGHVCITRASEHGFCDGAQHQRRPSERYRPSSFDSGLFILLNGIAKERWTSEKLKEILTRFKEAMSGAKGDLTSIEAYEKRVRKLK